MLQVPKILALDTASDICSVALQLESSIIERYEIAPKKQSELILPMVQAVLREAHLDLNQLDAIAFSCGPGSFTGIRLATSITQGLCFGADLKAIPISTLQAMAQSYYRQQKLQQVITAVDARMQEIYWAVYQADANNLMQPLINDSLCKFEYPIFSPAMRNFPWHGIGNAWQVYGENLSKKCEQNSIKMSIIQLESYPMAIDILKLASVQYENGFSFKAQDILPVYLQEEMYSK